MEARVGLFLALALLMVLSVSMANANEVGFSKTNATSTSSPLSITLPSGFSTYFWTAGVKTSGTDTAAITYNWTNSSIAHFVQTTGGPAAEFVANASVGFSTERTGTVDPPGSSLGIALAGIGANVIYRSNGVNGYVYTASTGTSQVTSLSLTYSVPSAGGFVVLLGSSANNSFSTPITYPSGCKQLDEVNGPANSGPGASGYMSSVFIANCTQSSGSYTITVKTSKAASIALAAYVFPRYSLTFYDNPTTGTITTNGDTFTNGQPALVVGTNAITANPPATGNWVFNSWSVSNSLNLSIANTLASSTLLTVMGNGTVTATWNGITKFYETGLPSGTKWKVTYDGILNSSTTNIIVFSTLPGTYSFTIPIQTINGVPYEPTPSSGSLYSGNAIAIAFKPFSVSISAPSNTVVDAGQYETFTATVYNGISPYTYNILVVNSITPSVIAHNDLVLGDSATSLTYTFQTTSADTSNSPEEANVIVTDSFSTPATVNSIYSSTFTIHPTPAATSLTPSNTILDSGQYVAYNVIINGGTLPITANLIYITGPTSNNVINGNVPGNVLQTVTLSVGSAEPNTITFNSFELTTQGSYTFNVVAVDSASTPVTFNAVANTLTVDPALSVSISPTSNTLDVGQTLTLTTNVIGGTPVFNIVYSGNDLCGSLSATSNTLSADGTNTIVFSPNTAITSACTANIMAKVTDGATTPSTASENSVITVDPAPTATSLTPSNTILDSGQYVTYNVLLSGGTLPITANLVLVSNALPIQINGANAVPGTTYNTIVTSSDNTITFNSLLITTSNTIGGPVTFNVVAVDSANVPVTFNAVANTIMVNPAPLTTLTATPSNDIMYGNVLTMNALITGGTGNFAVYWFIDGNAIASNSITTVIGGNVATSNTTLPAVGNYIYMVEANDIGTSSVYPLNGVTNTVVVYKNNTLTATSTVNPGVAYYQSPVSITFKGTPTLHNQSEWKLYVNNAFYGETNSILTWSENNDNVGTYNFVFKNGNANYTNYTYTTTLTIIYMPSGVSGVTSFKGNALAFAPVKLNLPKARASVLITTSSTVPMPITSFVSNITATAPAAPAGFATVSVLNISVNTTANVSVSVTQGYPCSDNASLIAPYIFKNGTWSIITPFAVNATACTVTYTVPKDPIVGILEKVPTTTTVPTTTVPTTTVPSTVPTTIPVSVPPTVPPSSSWVWITVVAIVIVIILVLLYYKLSHRKYYGFKR